MHNTIRSLYNLFYQDEGFLRFQKELAGKMYTALSQGYIHNENEVALVTRLVEAIDQLSYKTIRLFCNKIHGSRSYVKFNYMDKPTTTELADMVLISIVTKEQKRVLQRVAFIQNKVLKDKTCSIDDEQLFLLKNFPILSGDTGLFSGMRDVVFRNNSGVLGSYGLFEEPGEMIFLSAPLIKELSKGKKSITKNDISVSEHITQQRHADSSFFPFCGCLDPQECFYMFEKHIRRTGLPFNGYQNLLFENTHFARDLYDLSVKWTQLGIGEYSLLFDKIVNAPLHSFINGLLNRYTPKIGEYIDLKMNENIRHDYPESEFAIMVYLTDVTEL